MGHLGEARGEVFTTLVERGERSLLCVYKIARGPLVKKLVAVQRLNSLGLR